LIIPLHAANPGAMTGSGNWTYLLAGAKPVLIDAGTGVASHLDAIAAHVPDGPRHVLVTHAHEDHASGTVAIAARWPQTRFSKMPWPDRDTRYGVHWNALVDGQTIEAGDDVLNVVHTPGHAPDHICLWRSSTRDLFCGDLVVLGSTVVIPASSGGSLTDYLSSLSRVDALAPSRLLPAHGPAIEDPEAIIRRYIEHRKQREQQVLAALEDGSETVDRLTARIYVGLAAELMPMARESVLAHLVKLEHEGLVRRLGGDWERTASSS
jgi:glyoxylase-like metal-dependent hydrolase (beta-lactamase superfamily II)